MSLSRAIRRLFDKQQKKAAKKQRRKLLLEPLEPRLLLDGTMSYTASGALDATLRLNDDILELINNSDESVLTSKALIETDSVNITGGDLADALMLDIDFDLLSGPLSILFDGAGGEDSLSGPSSDTTWSLTGPNSGTAISGLSGTSTITFSDIENLVGAIDNADSFVFGTGVNFNGSIDGGDGGSDTLDYSAFTSNVTVDLSAHTATSTGGVSNIENIIGSAFNDILIGDENDNVIKGGAGDDTYVFAADSALGNDTIIEFVDEGTDTLDFSSTSLNLNIDLSSADPHKVCTNLKLGLSAGDVIENIIAGAGADKIMGNSLDNEITGGPGRDVIAGGDGFDTLVEARDANFTLSDKNLIIGSDGKDNLSEIESAYLTGGDQSNNLDTSAFTLGPVVLDGAGGNDILKGGSGNDVLIGGPGDDNMTGGRGDDTYVLDPDGTDSIYEADGNGFDTLDYSAYTTPVMINLPEGTASGTYGISSIENLIGAGELVIAGTSSDDTIVVRDDATAGNGSMQVQWSGLYTLTFTVPADSLKVEAKAGADIIDVQGLDSLFSADLLLYGYDSGEPEADPSIDQVTFTGDAYTHGGDLEVFADRIYLHSGVTIDTTSPDETAGIMQTSGTGGDINFTAAGSLDAALADVDSIIDIDGATIIGGAIALTARSTVTATAEGIFDGLPASAAVVDVDSHATIDIHGASQITAGSTLTIEATASAITTATSTAQSSGGSTTLDAAVATSIVDSAAVVHVYDMATLSAAGALAISAENFRNVTTTADGESAGDNAAGASVAVSVISGDTKALIDGNASVMSAESLGLHTTTVTNVTTHVTAASQGAEEDGDSTTQTESRKTLADYDAGTSSGSITLAGAVGVTVLDGNTLSSVASGGTITTSGMLDLAAHSTSVTTTTADGTAVGDGSTGVGVAVAIGISNVSKEASIGGTGTVSAQGLSLEADMTESGAADRFTVTATSGAGASDIGVAGSLAMNIFNDRSEALLKSGSQTTVTGDVDMSATGMTIAATTAQPEGDGSSGGSVGIGASVALTIADVKTRAAVEGTALLTGAHDLILATASENAVTTTAKAGAAASDGVSLGAAVAISVVTNETLAGLGAGDETLIAGNLALGATHAGNTTTIADGSTSQGSSAAIGAALALNIATDTTTATTLRPVDVDGNAALTAQATTASTATASATAAGGKTNTEAESQGDSVDDQAAGERNFADTQAANSGTGARGSGAAADTPSASTSGGGVTVAAAIGINISEADTSAYVPDDGQVTVGGALTLTAHGSSQGISTADGSATGSDDSTSSVGVGAAVALNLAKATTDTTIGTNADITAGSLSMDAAMTGAEFSAEAQAGAGSADIGVAGSVAINIVDVSAKAVIGSGAEVVIDATYGGTGNIDLNAEADVTNTAVAEPTDDGGASGGTVGIGASVALNIIDVASRAEVADTALLSNASGGATYINDITLEAASLNTVITTAKAGGAASGGSGGSGGVGIGAGVSVAVVDNETIARLGSGAPGVDLRGDVSISAEHTGDVVTTVGSKAAGDSAAIGAAVGVNVVNDTTTAHSARNLSTPTGAVTIQATNVERSTMEVEATAKGSSDSDEGGKQADQQATDEANQSNVKTRKGSQTLPSAQNSVDGADGTSNDQAGQTGGSSGVGVAASVGVTVVKVNNEASIEDGITIATGGSVTVRATAETDAATKALGASLSTDASNNIGAAVGVNVATVDNTALLGADTTISGSEIAVEAVTPSGESNDFIVWGLAAAGGKGNAFAGSVGVNVVTLTTKASAGKSADLDASGDITFKAENTIGIQNIAGAAGVGKGVGVGAAVAVNVVTSTTEAFVESGTAETDRSTVDAGGNIILQASASESPLKVDIPLVSDDDEPFVTGLAMSGGLGTGDFALGGSATVNVFDLDTHAFLGSGAIVNADRSVLIEATDTTAIKGGAGGLGATTGSAGIGIGLDVGVVNKDTRAYVGPGAFVHAADDVTIRAASNEDILSIAVAGGAADSLGIGGAVSVQVLTTGTRAYIDSSADLRTTVYAGGNMVIFADGTADIEMIAGGLGVASTAGIGVANTTLVHSDTVEAYINPSAHVEAHGDTGLSISADSTENVVTVAVAGGAAGTAGVAGSVTVNVLTETTRAFIGQDVEVYHQEDQNRSSGVTNVSIAASDDTKVVSTAGSVSFGGTAGVGAGADVEVFTKTIEAYVGKGAKIDAEGNVSILAGSSEDLLSIAASGSVGGSAGIAGSVGVSVFALTTLAYVENGTSDSDRSKIKAGGTVAVSASDKTEIDVFAGNIAGGGAAGFGAAAAVPVVTKTVESYIGSWADIDAYGDGSGLTVKTGEFDAPTYLLNPVFSGGGTITFAQNGTDPDTIDRSTGSWTTDGFKAGQAIQVSGTYDGEDEDKIGDNDCTFVIDHISEDGQTVYLRGGENVQGLSRDEVIAGSDLTVQMIADETGSIVAPPAGKTDVNDDNTSDFADDPSQTGKRVVEAGTASINGVAVTAVNQDTIRSYGLTGGIGGALAVNVGGAVQVTTVHTKAHINTSADVDAVNGSVLVGAGNDYAGVGVAAGISISGTASVTPSVVVDVANLTTEAYVDDGASVDAAEDIVVRARASEDILSIAVGVAGSGTVSISGSVPVTVLSTRTRAFIGEDAASTSAGAKATAGGNILVSAQDDTDADVIAGSVAVGIGGAGLGASVGVTVIDKNTEAFIGDYAVVDARGNTAGTLDDVHTGEFDVDGGFAVESGFRGLAVQAASSEDLLSVAAAGAGGLWAGIAGGVTVEIIRSDTNAFIGESAGVNTADGGEGADQSVNLTAINDARVLSIGGGLGIGFVGISGGVDVGILRNDTAAYIGGSAEVEAQKDVDVNALAVKNVDTMALSVSAGVVGAAGSVSVWTVGGNLESSYDVDEGTEDSLMTEDGGVIDFADDEAGGTNSDYTSILSGFTGDGDRSSEEVASRTSGVGTKIGSAAPYDPVTNSVTAPQAPTPDPAETMVPDGTVAFIGAGANVAAGGDIGVRAEDHLAFDGNAGGIAAGVGAIGASIIVGTVDNNVEAYIDDGATVEAGSGTDDDILVRAGFTETTNGSVYAALAGGIAVGAQVTVLTENTDVRAYVDEGAKIDQAGGKLQMEASSERSVDSLAAGGSFGGVTAGATVAVANVGGSVEAFIAGADVGQADGKSVKDVVITANSTSTAITNAEGGAGGGIAVSVFVPKAVVNGSTRAYVGPGTTLTAGSIDVAAAAIENATASGIAIGAGAVEVTVATPTAKVASITESFVGTPDQVTAGSTATLILTDEAVIDATNDSRAGADIIGGGAGGIAVNVFSADAKNSAKTYAYIGENSNIEAGSLSIDADSAAGIAVSKATLGGGGALDVQVALAEASNTQWTKAWVADAATISSGGGLAVKAESNNAAKAVGSVKSGGVISGQGVEADATAKPVTQAWIGSDVVIDAEGTVSVEAIAQTAEADASASSGGGGGITVGVGWGRIDVEPTVQAWIGSGTRVATTEDVIVNAELRQEQPDDLTDLLPHSDVYPATDEIIFANHGLNTGDVVTYDPLNWATADENDTAAIQTGTSTSSSTLITDRDYGVIRIDADTLALGAAFDGAWVDTDRDVIVFDGAHNFRTGDAVVYSSADGVGDVVAPGTYYVRVIDANTVKLYTTNYAPVTFSATGSGLITDGNRLNLSGFSNGDLVTYRAKEAVWFTSDAVDVRPEGEELIQVDNDKIYIRKQIDTDGDGIPDDDGDHGFVSGEVVTYRTDGTAIGGLTNEATYRIAIPEPVVRPNLIQLKRFSAVSGLQFDQVDSDNDTITRYDGGSWLLDGFAPGEKIHIEGTDHNNNPWAAYTIVAVTDSQLIVEGDRLTDEFVSGITMVTGEVIPLDASGASGTHVLSPKPLGGLEDGMNYTVINSSGESFQLQRSDGTIVSSITVDQATGIHSLGIEGVALNADGATPDPNEGTELNHQLRIDLTGTTAGAINRLLGPGGASLSQISGPVGDGQSLVTAKGGRGGAIAVDVPTAEATFCADVQASIDAALVVAGGNVSITTLSAASVSAYANSRSGGVIQVGEVDSTIDYYNFNNAYVGHAAFGTTVKSITGELPAPQLLASGVQIEAAGDFRIASETSIITANSASGKGGGFVSVSDANADTDIVSRTNTLIGSGATITAKTVDVEARLIGLDAEARSEATAGGFAGGATARADHDIDSSTLVLLEGASSGLTTITGLQGMDVVATQENFEVNRDTKHHWYGLFGGSSGKGDNSGTVTNLVDADPWVVVNVGVRPTVGSPLDSFDPFDHLALLVKADNGEFDGDGIDQGERKIMWDADVNVDSGPSPELVIDSDGKVVRATDVTVNGIENPAAGTDLTGAAQIEVADIFNHGLGDVVFQAADDIDGGTAGYAPHYWGTFTFDMAFDSVRITNASDIPLWLNSIDPINTTESPRVHMDLDNVEEKLQFAINQTVGSTLIDVRNLGESDIMLRQDKRIDNPVGETRMLAAGGDIFAEPPGPDPESKTYLIRTRALGDAGSTTVPADFELEQDRNWTGTLQFMDSGVEDAPDSLTRSDGTGWEENGFVVGDLIKVEIAGQTPQVFQIAALNGATAVLNTRAELSDLAVLFPTGASAQVSRFHGIEAAGSVGTADNPIRIESIYSPDQTAQIFGEAGGDLYLDLGARFRGMGYEDQTAKVDLLTAGNDTVVTLHAGTAESGRLPTPGVDVSVQDDPEWPYTGNYKIFYWPDERPTGIEPGDPYFEQAVGGISIPIHLDTTWTFALAEAGRHVSISAADSSEPGSFNWNYFPTFATPTVNVLGTTNIKAGGAYVDVLTNGYIGTEADPFGELVAVDPADGDDLRVGTIHSTYDDVSLYAPRGIVDAKDNSPAPMGNDMADVIGNSIYLWADGGNIGSPNGGNDLEIDSQNSDFGTIRSRAAGSLFVTETAGAANVMLLQADGLDNSAAQMPALRFTVRESAAVGEDLNLPANGLVYAPQGSILLRVGDDITTDSVYSHDARILAGKNIDIYGDFARINESSSGAAVSDTGDPGAGTVMHLGGAILHGPSENGCMTQIYGNADDDSIAFTSGSSVGPRTIVYGSDGNDTIDARAVAVNATVANAGIIILGGRGNDIVFGSQGDDLILGDNGWVRFGIGSENTHLSEVWSDPYFTSPTTVTTTNTPYLSAVTQEPYSATAGSGEIPDCNDTISGESGSDTVIGGVGADTIYSDDAGLSHGTNDGQVVAVGDNARIFYAGATGQFYTLGNSPVLGILTTDTDEMTGGVDTIWGSPNVDVLIGGVPPNPVSIDDAIHGDPSIDVIEHDNCFVIFVVSQMTAESTTSAPASMGLLSDTELTSMVAEAQARWEETLGNSGLTYSLESIQAVIADLPGDILGFAVGDKIVIDTDAAGYGWYVDPTPAEDAEFLDGSAPAGMDLLTVVMHEMGHVLGLDDVSAGTDIMSGSLAEGVRLVPTAFSVDQHLDNTRKEEVRNSLIILETDGSKEKGIEEAMNPTVEHMNDWLVDFLEDLGAADSNPNKDIAITIK